MCVYVLNRTKSTEFFIFKNLQITTFSFNKILNFSNFLLLILFFFFLLLHTTIPISTPDRSNIFGSSLIDKKLNYYIEKQSHLPRLSTNHLNNQIISDQLLTNYYAMSVAAVTNNQIPLHTQLSGPNKPQPRKKWSNDYSISLSKEENEYLFSLLGERCVVSLI